MNLFNDQAVKIRKVETVLAGLFIAAMIFGAVCMTLDMMDQAAVCVSVRIWGGR